ncbi:glycosyltransferase [Sporosarcina sp. Sa2YVA2]|uniref:Glycosyltransferase n=1 Tax=Sporosarcina quadrami TaxID=2762234 RepID=A0ABR8U964_9BACL|nr:glycosyltransferase [Sporosarcina quadrami]MBD7984578.1 glycosyltransferase [Sporosarcina quadrami]
MSNLIIICFGFDNEDSTNANSLCLYEILNNLSYQNEINIITSTLREDIHLKTESNINTYYLPVAKKRNGKIDFKKWENDILFFFQQYLKGKLSDETNLLTISFPLSTLTIGKKVKKKFPRINWLVYELDPYAFNKVLRLQYLLFFYRFFKEFNILASADKVMLTHELYNQYTRSPFYILKRKFVDFGIPLMKIHNKDKNNIFTKETVTFAYIGSFYKKIRNPEYMFKVFLEVVKTHKNFILNLYGLKKDDLDKKYVDLLGENLVIHGRVSKNVISKVIEDTDFLINIGNSISNQLPSKVLEYIGTGKPIINFYTIKNDTSNKYLTSYPYALLLKQLNGGTNEQSKKVINFVDNHIGVYATNKQLTELYYYHTVEAVSIRLLKMLK